MANTYTNLFFHVVFGVKDRRSLLDKQLREELFCYIVGITKVKDFQISIINGTKDHVHILMLLKPGMSVSKAVQLIKSNSSRWIHEKFNDLQIFSWQDGYGAFTVSLSQLPKVKQYIMNQEKHHEKMDFQQEYRQLLKMNNIEFDEKYLF